MAPPQKDLIAISVQFTILTPDQLKEIKFGLSKTTEGSVEIWNITFSLSTREKKTDPLVKLIDATVKADLKDNPAAEATALDGPNKAQTDHLTLNVAKTAERVAAKQLKPATLDRQVKATIPARNA